MKEPLICLSCASKPCQNVEVGTFDICKYGIAFCKRDDFVEKKEQQVQLSNISRNLRHEINPILQTIIEQTTKLDLTLSVREIDLNKPLSVIIGATVILDNFIQMITGVHEFHATTTDISKRKIKLKDIIDYHFVVYAILKEEARTKDLRLNNLIPDNYYISFCSDFIGYIFAVLVDNAWKYSIDDSVLTVNINSDDTDKCKVTLTNQSETLPEEINIFDLGVKFNPSSKGFGYGLFWAKILEFNYNTVGRTIEDDDNRFYIKHKQHTSQISKYSFQEFTLNNLIIEKI